jgi:hypothetical protein
MAGPTGSVIAKFDGAPPTWRELMAPYSMDWLDNNFCWISDTRPIGGSYQGELRPFVGFIESLVVDAQKYPDDAAYCDAVRRFTNRDPTHSVVVSAMCNRTYDHEVLCEILIDLATRIDGIIDFDFLDVPHDSGLQRCDWIFENETNWTILGSPSEAKVWLRHPAFRMLK